MSTKNNKEKRITVRLTNSRHSNLLVFAKAHEMTISKAIEFLLDEGLKSQNQEPIATKSDIDRLLTETKQLQEQQEITKIALVQAIKEQPITVQQIGELKKKRKHKFLKFLNSKNNSEE